MKSTLPILAALLLPGCGLAGAANAAGPAVKLVLADYHGPRLTRAHDGALGVWRQSATAQDSQAARVRWVFNADLLDAAGLNQLAGHVHPLVGMQSQLDEDYLEYEILQAKTARIDGFMVEWSVPASPVWQRLRAVAERLHFLVGANWCDAHTLAWRIARELGPDAPRERGVEMGCRLATDLRRELYDSPTAPKLGGQPLVFLFGGLFRAEDMAGLRAAWGNDQKPLFVRRLVLAAGDREADRQVDDLAGRLDGVYPWTVDARPSGADDPELKSLRAQRTHDKYSGLADVLSYRQRMLELMGGRRLNAAFPVRVGSVLPGMDNRPCAGWGQHLSYIASNAGDTQRKLWELYAAKRDRVDIVFIATWNDFTEGTAIQPSVEHGLRDVRIAEAGAAAFKGTRPDASGLELPSRLFRLRQSLGMLGQLGFDGNATRGRLDAIAQCVALAKYREAEQSLAREESLQASLRSGVREERLTIPLAPAGEELTAETARSVTLPLPAEAARAMRSGRFLAELRCEWFDDTDQTWRLLTEPTKTQASDGNMACLAEITGESTGQWLPVRIRIAPANCRFVGSERAAEIVVQGNVRLRNPALNVKLLHPPEQWLQAPVTK